MTRFWIAVLFLGSLKSASAQQSAVIPASSSFPRFTLSQGQLDEDGVPTSGAKLCVLGRRDICYQMPEYIPTNSGKVTYKFGLDPRSERLPLKNGGSWVFFSATYSGGGSGTLERIAVLRYEGTESGGKMVNLLPFVAVTNASNRLMWTIPSASEFPILIMADFIWGDGETHFGEHFYTVEAWRFDPKEDRYVKAISYRTAKKYAGPDTACVRVIVPERQEILKRLGAK